MNDARYPNISAIDNRLAELENEIQDNVWLIAEANIADVFAIDSKALYKRLIGKLGIDFAMLSNSGGEA